MEDRNREYARRSAALAAIVLGSSFLLCSPASAADCFNSSIIKPTPFMGNNDEIFQLADRSFWQVKYEYDYLFEFFPSVVVCPAEGKLILKGKQLNILRISAAPGNPGPPATTTSPSATTPSEVIQSRISGEFKGWEGDTIYQLQNGQVWKQIIAHYHYHYAYSPEVIVYPSGGGYKMHVTDDDDEDVEVDRLK